MFNDKINQFISRLLHPISVSIWAVAAFLWVTPHYLPTNTTWILVDIVVLGSIIFPLFILYFLKANNTIQSFELQEIRERKLPFMVFILLSLTLSKIFFKLEFTRVLGIYFLAGSVSFFMAYLLLFWKFKASIHTMGWSSLVGFLLHLSGTYSYNLLLPIGVLFLLLGLLTQARISLQAHTFSETLIGFLLGILPQIVLIFWY